MKEEYKGLEKIELKIYKLLGIKYFKKIVLEISLLKCIKQRNLTKSQKRKYVSRKPTNYYIGRKRDYESIKNFKRKLYSNARIHLYSLILSLQLLINNFSLPFTMLGAFMTIMNSYCVMLQRYNCIRINNTLRKMKPKYEKQKEEFKQALIKEDSLLKEHEYALVKNKKVKNITFEELIQDLTIEELKEYKCTLSYFKYAIENQEYENNVVVERLDRNTFLKLKLHI